MSAKDRLSDYLDQMKQGSADALTFVDGMDEDQFMSDLRTQRAVVMSLMIVGEAASRIVAEHPDFARPMLRCLGEVLKVCATELHMDTSTLI